VDGPPVLLLPGAASDASIWDDTAEHLGRRCQVHALSFAGFGALAPIDEPLLAAARRDLAGYLDALAAPAVVVGHSLGAYFAYALAIDRPARVRRVVAVDGVPAHGQLLLPGGHPEELARSAEAQRAALLRREDGEVRDWLAGALGAMTRRRRAEVERMARRCDRRTIAQAMYDLALADQRAGLRRSGVPVLLVLAGDPGEGMSAEAHRERCAAQLAGVARHRVVVIEGARHFVMLDAPDRFHAVLDEWPTEAAGLDPPRGAV
jgi:pimeloyl-ACP methyl ester carboxylesterase